VETGGRGEHRVGGDRTYELLEPPVRFLDVLALGRPAHLVAGPQIEKPDALDVTAVGGLSGGEVDERRRLTMDIIGIELLTAGLVVDQLEAATERLVYPIDLPVNGAAVRQASTNPLLAGDRHGGCVELFVEAIEEIDRFESVAPFVVLARERSGSAVVGPH